MGGIMNDDAFIWGITALTVIVFVLGIAMNAAMFHKDWKCSEAAIVDGTAECVEYRKVEEKE
jgi:hypothetical protein